MDPFLTIIVSPVDSQGKSSVDPLYSCCGPGWGNMQRRFPCRETQGHRWKCVFDEATTGQLIIPDTIEGNPYTSIGKFAFPFCSSLPAVTFLGDAPKAADRVSGKTSPTIYRKAEAKGWGETFGGRPVELISEKP